MRKPLKDLPDLNQFYLTGSAFKVVDWAVFSESTSQDLDVHFDKIETVTYTTTPTFVYDFEFKAYDAEIENIETSVGDLLNKEERSSLLIQGSKLGPCENFNWMTKISCPNQNDITGATCQKGNQRMNLSKYLKSVDRNTRCK